MIILLYFSHGITASYIIMFLHGLALCSDPMKLPLPPKIPAGFSEEDGKKRNNNNHAINFSNTTSLTELPVSSLPEEPDSKPNFQPLSNDGVLITCCLYLQVSLN